MRTELCWPEFEVLRDPVRCVNCKVCVRECANEVHRWDEKTGRVTADESKCVNCQRCVATCPTRALAIAPARNRLREGAG